MQNVAFVVLPVRDISIVTNTCFETATEVWDILPSMKKVKKYKSSIAIDLKRMRRFGFCMVSGASFGILKTLAWSEATLAAGYEMQMRPAFQGTVLFLHPQNSRQLF